MSSAYARASEEFLALSEKLAKLSAFSESEETSSLSAAHLTLLRRQASVMAEYLRILEQRMLDEEFSGVSGHPVHEAWRAKHGELGCEHPPGCESCGWCGYEKGLSHASQE